MIFEKSSKRFFKMKTKQQQNKQELDQNKIYSVVTFVTLGSLGCDKLFDESGLKS
jgi:hypothetical protein